MRLLDRQARLLDYLTSDDAIFGGQCDPPVGRAVEGMDCGLLHLEARFSHEKRMEKVMAVFPKTFSLLGDGAVAFGREFARAHAPVDIRRIENARQFYDFLHNRSHRAHSEPPYLDDVAACELAYLRARVGVEAEGLDPAPLRRAAAGSIRRNPDAVLIECAYDVRPIFENDSNDTCPIKRETQLAVAVPPGERHPKVFEVGRAVFCLLAMLTDWVERSALGRAYDLDELLGELAAHGLIEVHD
jgi:hypothetical protein